ncbi:MAG: YceK/YidQ family lipoprotein [Planctomycetia bacterium]|nr:YceK/YidQ family lipoprotein [Planctomycetia bacterium]
MQSIMSLCLLLPVFALGCGTFSAHFDGFNPQPYAGVKVTCDTISRACTSEESLNLYTTAAPEMRCLAGTGELVNRAYILACYTADLPFSFVADTLYLPVQACWRKEPNKDVATTSITEMVEPATSNPSK